MHNFDEEINRIGTNSSKYDTMQTLFDVSPHDGLSMWTADMDFRSPKCVSDTIKRLADHGIFGYYGNQESYNEAVCGWYEKRHNWRVKPDWISVCHGLVAGIGMAIRAFSNPGDGVIIFTPVYHSFIKMIKNNNRVLIEQPLKMMHGEYFIDFDKLSANLSGNEKILLFCSPHNPGGKIWSTEDLERVAKFCLEKNLILISDEIHHDLIFPGNKHIMYPIAVPEVSNRLVVMVSSSKTFNIAGGLMGNVIIQNPKLRRKFNAEHKAIGTSPNLFGMKIAESAYLGGEEWLNELMVYLETNRLLFDQGIAKITGLHSMKLASTYLAWVDFSKTGFGQKEIVEHVHKKAGIAASIGSTFGTGGEAFMRFNLACPTKRVKDAVQRLQNVFR